MKNISKNIMTGLLVVVFALSFSKMSFAHKEDERAFVKLTSDSANALQASRPDLATELKKWSDEEANEKEEKGEKKELEGKAEEEMHARRAAHLKLLRDSAAALQQSNPVLAAGLTKTADEKAKWMTEDKEGKEDTNEMEEKETK